MRRMKVFDECRRGSVVRRARTKQQRLGAVVLASALALAGVGEARADELERVTIGVSGGLSTAAQPVFFAQTSGLFRKHGVDVSVTSMTDDTSTVLSLISGAFDMVSTGTAAGFTAQSRGAPIKLVASVGPRSDYIFVAQTSIETLKDMSGRAVGISKLGSVSHAAAMLMLRTAGLDPTDVRFVPLGNDAARGQALAMGVIDGSPLIGVQAILALQASPHLHAIGDGGAPFSGLLYTGVFTTDAAVARRPDAVRRVVEALIESCRKLQADEEAAVRQAVAMGLPPKAIRQDYDMLLRKRPAYFGVDGGMTRENVRGAWDMLRFEGAVTSTMNFETVAVPYFVSAALKSLGPYKTP